MLEPSETPTPPIIIDLGEMNYDDAYAVQVARVEEVLSWRAQNPGPHPMGYILTVVHSPAVITISRRPGAGFHLLATTAALNADGIQVRETDRGGDITYHGPGQLVVYPIIDIQRIGLGLHSYMRLLEQAVIDTCAQMRVGVEVEGIVADRDAAATGVFIAGAKACAMGVRVRKWVTMHGLALNISTNLAHFDHIVPCGLVGRSVTSLHRVISQRQPKAALPSFAGVRELLLANLQLLLAGAAASRARPAAHG